MKYNRFLELSEEFGEFVKSLHALYLDSVIGFKVLHRRLIEHRNQMKSMLGKSELSSDEFQDECLIVYKHLCGEDLHLESTKPFMTQREVKERTEQNGRDYILLGQLCVVRAYDYWETYLRNEIGVALGVVDIQKHTEKEIKEILNKYVAIDFWGDMRYIRHAISHNNAIATSDFNKIKFLTWFKPGEPVNLDFEKMQDIFGQMGDFRNILHNLSLPPSTARFPS
jgi:hypothetical protein